VSLTKKKSLTRLPPKVSVLLSVGLLLLRGHCEILGGLEEDRVWRPQVNFINRFHSSLTEGQIKLEYLSVAFFEVVKI
jgi:hypothetical protein